MKNNLLFLSFLLVFCSCSVQKRHYRDGFYLNWLGHSVAKTQHTSGGIKHAPPATSVAKSTQSVAKAKNPASDPELSASTLPAILPAKHTTNQLVHKKTADSCDVIVFRDGTELRAKILEINAEEVKYKKCEMMDGPDFRSSKSRVFMIKFANGAKEVFESKTPVPAQKRSQEPAPKNDNAHKSVHPLAVYSLVTGVIGFIIGLGILSIILGNLAIRRIKERPDIYKGEALANIGIILGSIRLGVFILLLVFVVFAFLLA